MGIGPVIAAAVLVASSAAAAQPPPVIIPPLRPPLALPPPPPAPPPLRQQTQPPDGEGARPRDAPEQDEARRRRPRAPNAERVLPPMRCLEAAAFDPPIDEPVTSSGNYELWIEAGRRRPYPARDRGD